MPTIATPIGECAGKSPQLKWALEPQNMSQAMAVPALNVGHADHDDSGELASERIFIAVTPTMKRAVEDLFHAQRFKSESAAARHLLHLGLQTMKWRKTPS